MHTVNGRTVCPENPIHHNRVVVEDGLTIGKRIQGGRLFADPPDTVVIQIPAVRYIRGDGVSVLVGTDGYTAEQSGQARLFSTA